MWRFALGALSTTVAAALMAGLAAELVSRATGLEPGHQDPSGVAFTLAPAALAFVALALLGGFTAPLPRRELFSWRLPPLGAWVWTTAGMLGLSLALGAAIGLFGLDEQGNLAEINRALSSFSVEERLWLLPATALLPAIAEELFFRGLIFGLGREVVGARGALWVSAVLFGAVHFDLVQSPAAMLMGLFLGWSLLRGGSLPAVIAAHFVNNTVATMFPNLDTLAGLGPWALLFGGSAAFALAVWRLAQREAPVVGPVDG
jgi:membrane protease YdiL (CAAX protease family)